MKRRNAFTLTELLVLIAAGTLVGGVLLASLGDAKEKVRAAACMSNLREISLAIRLYTDDNGGYMPTPSGGAGAPTWPKLLGPYLPLRGPTPTSPPHKVFVCPSANYPGFQNQDLNLTYSCTGAMLGFALPGLPSLTAMKPRRQDQVLTPPAETPLIVEGKRDYTGPSPNCRSNYAWSSYAAHDLALSDPASCNYLDFRHSDAMNIAFFDGSVRWLSFLRMQQAFPNNNAGKSLWEGR